MSGYIFRQRCRPQGDWRIDEVIEFLDLVEEAFRCSTLYDSSNRPVDISETGLRKIFEKAAKRLLPGLGANEHFYTIPPRKRDDNTVSIEIHTGTHPTERFIDSYDILMGDKGKVPDFDYFEKSIQIFKPFEAFLAERQNEFKLDTFNREALPGILQASQSSGDSITWTKAWHDPSGESITA